MYVSQSIEKPIKVKGAKYAAIYKDGGLGGLTATKQIADHTG